MGEKFKGKKLGAMFCMLRAVVSEGVQQTGRRCYRRGEGTTQKMSTCTTIHVMVKKKDSRHAARAYPLHI